MANKVQFGLSNVYFAVLDEKTGKYSTPVSMPGAENLSVTSNTGSDFVVYADDGEYWRKGSASSKQGDLQMARFSDEFREQVLGQTKEEGGGYSEGPNDAIKPFALLFQVKGDNGGQRVVWFKCTATAPTATYATVGDSTTEASETSTITASAANVNGEEKTAYFCHKGDKNYEDFFKAVPLVVAGA